jgi:hypothetical protein
MNQKHYSALFRHTDVGGELNSVLKSRKQGACQWKLTMNPTQPYVIAEAFFGWRIKMFVLALTMLVFWD